MAKKRARAKSRSKGKKRSAKPRAAKKTAKRGVGPDLALVRSGMHDLTNLATAIRAYLELLNAQSKLEEKQKYYVDRAREQVEMMVDLVREMRDKIG